MGSHEWTNILVAVRTQINAERQKDSGLTKQLNYAHPKCEVKYLQGTYKNP